MMFPLGCLIRKKPTGTMIFSSPVAALDNADLAISSGYDVKAYSFIPSGDPAGACDARHATAHVPIANLVNNRAMLVMKISPPFDTSCRRDPLLTVLSEANRRCREFGLRC